MKKMGQFVYKDHDIILWEERTRKGYEYGGIVVNEEEREWETDTSTSLSEIINRAITHVDNAPLNTMRP
jgi:hypothetical protein